MPYLHRKPFIRHPPPPGLQLNERLFHCRLTNEGFRDYDEFFERTILCNSLVWSCSLSGKSGLTYSEALESEKKIRISLQNFPQPLILPVLYLSTLTVRHRVTDLCEDVFGYVKNRFFVGETVDVVRNSGARLECKVLEVKLPPQENGLANGYNNHDDDTIVISDSDDEPSNDPPQNGKKKEPVDPSLLKYKVKPIKKELYESVTVKSCQVSRKPALFSQERLKLFLKLHCEPQNGIIKLKARSHAKYEVSEKNFLRYFPDDPPLFQHSTVLRGQTGKSSKVSHRGGGLSNEKKSKSSREQERILKHKNELRAIELEKARIRREHVEIEKHRVRERQNKEREREEQKKFLEEERLKRKEEIERLRLEKEKEREKIREEKRKYAEHLKLWSKPREDMECDDLKELPTPTSVKTRVPPDCFGDAIMVLEFLHSFGDLFDLRDEFPEGMTFDMLEEALVGSNPEGPLCELLFFFLTAIFQAMTEEEEEVAKDQIIGAETKDLTEALDEVTDPTKSVLSAVASLAAAWPQLHQGCMLKDLDLDSCTLSEILRLHILSSGAEANSASAKYRYQKQGGFDATDDACVEFRLSHPALLKKLSSSSVYALEPGEKLKILHALCGQLLTLVSTRDYIEDYFEELRQSKQEYRELKSEQNRRGREGAAARIRKRKVHKLQEQELKMKDKHEKLKEEENASLTKGTGNDDFDTGSENKDALQNDPDSEAEDATTLGKKGNKIQNGLRDGKTSDPNAEGTLEKKEPLTPEEEEAVRQEQQKKEQELLKNIQEATSCTNIFPLGRDRWYRRFWTFSSVPGLFVEEDYYGLSEDMLEARPISHRDAINAALNGHESSVQETKEVSKPVTKPNRWWFYNSTEQLDQLIECLNTRGYRECSLRYTLMQEKGKISKKLAELPVSRFHVSDDTPPADAKPIRGRSQNMPDQVQTSGEKHLQIRLCDLLLDIEDRIYQGTLGTVKVPDRQTWRASIEKCCMETSSEETKENGVLKTASCDVEEMDVDSKHSILDRVQGLKNDTPSATSTSTNTPLPVNNTVRFLARALLQIEHGVERKFLKSPLGGADDIKKDKKSLKKKDEEQSTEKDDASDGGRTHRTVLDRWRESLSSSCSLSQIFLHLSTLDHSILWSRSILNARCRVCRKKGDSESMLLCDGCDRGHHIYCVRPKLKYVPEEDWFCPECRPKQRSRRPPARQRPSVDSDEEMEEVEEEEESDHSESENEEEEQSDESYEESPPKRGKAKVRFPLKKGGKAAGKPGPKKKGKISRSLQGTPKNNMSAPRGRGRGTGRKVHSAPPLVSKTSTRVSARKAQGITMSSGTSPLEQGSLSGKGLGRGRGGGRGRGRMQKSADNTPVGSPFTLRPFSLDSPEATGRRGRGQSKNSMTVQLNSTGQSKKRLSTDISGDKINRRSSGRHQGVHELSACEQLVVELVRHEDSWPFMKLVSKIQVPDYFDIIQKPIALNLIREKVNKCDYKSASEFVEDVQLMFSNCFEYNHFNSNEARAGVRLQSFFTNEAEKLGLEVSRSNSHHSRPPAKRSRI